MPDSQANEPVSTSRARDNYLTEKFGTALTPDVGAALLEFCQQEHRSPAAALRVFTEEALIARGKLPRKG